MPLVRIALIEGRSAEERRRIGEAVHQAMVDTIGVPARDRFQLITQHAPEDFVYDAEYLGVERSDDLVVVQITLNAGRTLEQKRAFYRRIADTLGQAVGLRPQDVLVSLVEVAKENWSFGNGLASYAPAEAAAA